MSAKPVLALVGTRPEAIKMAPIILRLQQSAVFQPVICSTGQHREMLNQALADFNIHPDINLTVMQEEQTLTGLAGRLFLRLEKMLSDVSPACILVQGDTTTAYAGAVSGFYTKIPVGHVEAGLRSGDMYAPYPEEFNRRAISLAATWHFAPTQGAANNLLQEGVAADRVLISGNTVVDALMYMRAVIRQTPPPLPPVIEDILRANAPYVLITAHRRENFGQGMEDICSAIESLAHLHPNCFFIYPVHLNPQVRKIVEQRLSNLPNVILTEPCGYRPFLRLLDNCLFVLSDSGGIQEESPSFGKRVLVMRDRTERPEGVEAGFCRLVGASKNNIITAAEELFVLSASTGLPGANPYGDGNAAERIVTQLEKNLIGNIEAATCPL
ncbi:non-hydrolyzing UDP-N-acetylglucosamine 2-epimerase [Desulfovibrio desulfuricans]|uniref:non-hydrolyzing UDP-N-acetylglucosamine 2-epimerase n=1 Tax=Desulfovibrio desulfuricans TaxID=876 RepID=UPI0003B460F1|nr:UDP-N-acetylglucosamine 2-epimerase (non-hydrolyzing) [Desulfovibrio desulfuricans]